MKFVTVSFHIVLCLVDCGFCSLDCCSHPFCKFIDCFQTGRVLPGFEAYARKPSSVEQKQRLLSSRVDVIVVLELCQG